MKSVSNKHNKPRMIEGKKKYESPADAYEVIKVLGKGSFGVVRLVREKNVNE